MNKLFLYLSLLTLCFSSCEKYEFDTELPTIEGTTWVLVNGRVFVENLTNGELTYYDHFNGTQITSNLDIFGGSSVDVDNLEQNVTTWYFQDGIFTLNNGNTYDYDTRGSGSRTQYTLLGVPPYGSVRSLGILSFTEDVLNVKVYESNESYGDDNYHYYTVLTFVRAGYECPSCTYTSQLDYVYNGVINLVNEDVPGYLQLEGTSWLVTRYDNGMTPVYPNDTINFLNGVTYNVNGSNTNSYSLSNNVGNNLYNLTLYECVTFGGNYSGQVSLSFIEEGELNNLSMDGIFGTSGSISVWLERIN